MPAYPYLIHHGGSHGVTGSCHQFFSDRQHSLMIDCGLFQGDDARQLLDKHGTLLRALRFDPQILHSLKALVLTHVHIDHVGRLPWLLAVGYSGPVYCSEPSALLLPAVMEDALAQGFTRKKRLIRKVLQQLQQQLRPLPYGQPEALWPGLELTLQPAGHILGSAYVSLDTHDGQRTLFSGDLGAPWSPLLGAPESPDYCHHLILESTYGDRKHQRRKQRRKTLESALRRALNDGGTVLIPAFSLGRTQELLYELEDIITSQKASGGDLASLEVILDSPLAERFTGLYREMRPFWDAEAHAKLKQGRKPLAFDNLLCISDHHSHQQTVQYLAGNHRPAVVLAASGMCAGGRIVNYLKAMLADSRHNVLFVGYQAQGSAGRSIQKYGPRQGWVELDNQRIDIRAGVETISGYSAHADQKDLLNFIRGMQQPPACISLVHGEAGAQARLAEKIRQHWPDTEVRLGAA